MSETSLSELQSQAARHLTYVKMTEVEGSELPVRLTKRSTGVTIGYYKDQISALEDLLKKDLLSIAAKPQRRFKKR